MSSNLQDDILKAKTQIAAMQSLHNKAKINYCHCLKTQRPDEYWGHWLECECGFESNVEYAKYCGGCGKEIRIIGITKNKLEHFGQR